MAISKRLCKDCGKDISNLQPQCTRCRECQKEYRELLDRKYMQNKRKNRAPHRLTDLGTTDFSSHREEDFDKEAEAVKEELKKLRLRK